MGHERSLEVGRVDGVEVDDWIRSSNQVVGGAGRGDGVGVEERGRVAGGVGRGISGRGGWEEGMERRRDGKRGGWYIV